MKLSPLFIKAIFTLVLISTFACNKVKKEHTEFKIEQMYLSSESSKIMTNHYNKDFSTWPSPARTSFIKSKFGKTHVIEWGDTLSDTLILIHGLSGNTMQWGKKMINELSKDFYIISLETIGDNVGKSIPNHWPIKQDSLKLWLHETIDSLHIKKANIAGLAFGGWIAHDFAMHYPNRINKLTLIGSAGFGKPNFISLIKILLNLKKNNDKGIAKAYSYLRTPGAKLEQCSLDYLKIAFENCKPISYMPRRFKPEALKKNTVSTLIIMGEDDCYFNPNKSANWARKHLPQSKIHILKDAGHLINMDKPVEVSSLIKSAAL